MRLHHHAIKVRDVSACLPFYRDVLRLRESRVQHDHQGLRSVWFELEHDAFLAIERSSTHTRRGDDDVGHHCLALRIERSAREEWMARFAACGHPVFRSTEFSIYVRDPEGSVIALSHFPQGIEP